MTDFKPEGWSTVTPRIAVADHEGLVGFITRVFDADGELLAGRPTELKIGDSIVMVGGVLERGPMQAFLYVYVPDADSVYRRAVDAGAASVEAPRDTPYGDRRAMVRDNWGNVWQIATRRTG